MAETDRIIRMVNLEILEDDYIEYGYDIDLPQDEFSEASLYETTEEEELEEDDEALVRILARRLYTEKIELEDLR